MLAEWNVKFDGDAIYVKKSSGRKKMKKTLQNMYNQEKL